MTTVVEDQGVMTTTVVEGQGVTDPAVEMTTDWTETDETVAGGTAGATESAATAPRPLATETTQEGEETAEGP